MLGISFEVRTVLSIMYRWKAIREAEGFRDRSDLVGLYLYIFFAFCFFAFWQWRKREKRIYLHTCDLRVVSFLKMRGGFIGKKLYLSASEAARFIQLSKQAEPAQALC